MMTVEKAIQHIQATDCPYWYLEKREGYGAFKPFVSWMGAGDKAEELPDDMALGLEFFQNMVSQYKGVQGVFFRLNVKKSKSTPKSHATGNLMFTPEEVQATPTEPQGLQGHPAPAFPTQAMPSFFEMMTYLKSHEDDIRAEKRQLFERDLDGIAAVNQMKDKLRETEAELKDGARKKEFELFKKEQELARAKERFDDEKKRWDEQKKEWDEEKEELEKRLSRRSTATIKALEKWAPRVLGFEVEEEGLSGVGAQASPQEEVINRIANRLYQMDLDLRVLLSVEKAAIQYVEKIKKEVERNDAKLDSEEASA